MHVTSVTRQELTELKRAFSACDFDNDGRIDAIDFSILLRLMFEEDQMFLSLLSGVVNECKKKTWVYFPDFLATLVRNRDDPFYEEIWHRFVALDMINTLYYLPETIRYFPVNTPRIITHGI